MMIIDPEKYYRENLQGKNLEEIETTIDELHQQIDYYRESIESPWSTNKELPEMLISHKYAARRKYLERAIEAYTNAGGIYKPTEREKQETAFNELIPNVTKIVFEISTYMSHRETRTIWRAGEQFNMRGNSDGNNEETVFSIEESYFPMDKEDFLDDLKYVRIGEWNLFYDNPSISDGTQWELTIFYSEPHKPVRYRGSNAYPLMFNWLLGLFGIDGGVIFGSEENRFRWSKNQ